MESKSSMPSSSLIDQQVLYFSQKPLYIALVVELSDMLGCQEMRNSIHSIETISITITLEMGPLFHWHLKPISQILVYISPAHNIEDMESEAMISKDMKVDEALARQGSITKSSCLCSPTTHAGSFRCRLHRAPSLQRTKSIESATDSQSKDTAAPLMVTHQISNSSSAQ
ncbi:hypothetical protein SASPL_107301 [Salvia splendens]|uniref:Uncharacterized protein n=1 Tax=Salvia splendens TaxID=180675 RepID=A0A8X8YG71_SALSN|nr:hypothetical protein SASPL_107301 [Salvia splendens]